MQLGDVALHPIADPIFRGALGQTVNRFTFFTMLSNLVVFVVALRAASGGWRATPFNRVLMLDALVMIFVTGLIFNTMLEHTPSLTVRYASGVLLHDVAPMMTIIGWMIFAHPHNVSLDTVVLALILPLCWLIFTLVRATAIGWVPYSFLDASRHGYAHMIVVLAMILCVQMGLSIAAMVWDRRAAIKLGSRFTRLKKAVRWADRRRP